jgi:tRNA (guanine37-N1)-methyltransferase
MKLDVVTIFPDYLAPLKLSLLGKAQDEGLLEINVHDLRAHATDNHHSVDDTPYGGGAGMVMKAEVWGEAHEMKPVVSDTFYLLSAFYCSGE